MAHHQNIKLDVLADFRNLWILQGRGEVTNHRQSVGFRFRNGHIPSLLFSYRKRATNQLRTQWIKGICLRVKSEKGLTR